MAREGNEMQMMNGWPFGLGNMNSRIRLMDDDYSQPAAPPPPPPQPYASRVLRSSSFSSFSSSNLDTESTASFFPDRSMSLGRLIGIRSTANKKSLYHELRLKEAAAAADERSHRRRFGVSKVATQNSQGLCVPLLHHVLGRISGRS